MTQGTKLFGFRIPLDPKVLVGILFALALGLVWYNFSGGDDHPVNTPHSAAAAKPASSSQTSPSFTQSAARRAELASRNKQGTLRLRPVDPSRGDIDPTLKLWLLDRVRAVKLPEVGRNLFETGPELAQATLPVPKVKPIIPGPITPPTEAVVSAPPPPPVVNIPLRYYGFVRPSLHGDSNRGYFMDGENNILMATEGDVLESHFLVVTLSPNNARVEDIQLKQGQDLQLIPEAVSQ